MWCSGNIFASHANARGSIPRLRRRALLRIAFNGFSLSLEVRNDSFLGLSNHRMTSVSILHIAAVVPSIAKNLFSSL